VTVEESAFGRRDHQPEDAERLVTVGRFLSSTEAQMARGVLESEGIECFLTGENVNNLLGAAFRVGIQVQMEDEALARGLLERAEEATQGDSGEPSRPWG
jgi:hypothetical protein